MSYALVGMMHEFILSQSTHKGLHPCIMPTLQECINPVYMGRQAWCMNIVLASRLLTRTAFIHHRDKGPHILNHNAALKGLNTFCTNSPHFVFWKLLVGWISKVPPVCVFTRSAWADRGMGRGLGFSLQYMAMSGE